jgi:hypothetical protein
MPRAPQARQQSSSTTREQEQEQAAAPTGDVDETMDQTEQVEGEVDGYGKPWPRPKLVGLSAFHSLVDTHVVFNLDNMVLFTSRS